jgi:uncharacterized SAM-binding protein YcdF (DUF218 family)
MLRWIIRITVVAVLIVMAGAANEVVVRANNVPGQATDAIVVLGAAQFDGTPQPVFENRLRHAADMWFLRGGTVITVGGKLPGDRFTEADSGKRYLVDQGVSAKSVIAVPTGSDTWESLKAVAEVLRERDMSSVTVVSDPAHVARSRIKLLHLGIPTVEVSPTTTGAGSLLTSRYLVRETLGIMRFWITTDWFRDRGAA